MRLAVARSNGRLALYVVRAENETAYLVPPSLAPDCVDPLKASLDLGERAWEDLHSYAETCTERTSGVSLSSLELAAPVRRPGKVVCLASNYRAHMEEANVTRRTDVPWFFVKPSTAVIGPDAPIVLPTSDAAVDWEVELAVVIGRRCSHTSVGAALDRVAGYTIGNDVSLRSPPFATGMGWDEFFQWLRGKWYDTFSPLGPWLVTRDELDELANSELTLTVNEHLRQRGVVGEMIFSVAEVISALSSITTLDPGDVILTGTPSGVGAATGNFLRPGDVVEASIEGIGTLRNPVESRAAEPARS